MGFVCDVVKKNSVVLTDGWPSYGGLSKLGFDHRVSVIAKAVDPAHIIMHHVHRVAALLKRWLLGTHQGAASREHLDYYLDEFTFRFNRRTSQSRGLLFYRLLSPTSAIRPRKWRNLLKSGERNQKVGTTSFCVTSILTRRKF